MNGETLSFISSCLAVAFHVIIFTIALWDIWVMMNNRPSDTVSAILTDWSKRFPMVPLCVGLIIGHIFWK